MKNREASRITILDGLRVIAILMVILFHYFYRFKGTHYEYSIYIPEIFKFGYLGVQLFFIISGFVITLTLTKCNSFFEFIKKRFSRLIPAMLICSFITFIFISVFDQNNLFPNSTVFSNFLFSNTFISPILFNDLFSLKFDYIDGAYWSLWVEINFYIIAGLMYFISPKKLLRTFSIFTFIGFIGIYVFISSTGKGIVTPYIGENSYSVFRQLFEFFTFFVYSLWFLIGIVLKHLYFDKNNKFLFIYLFLLFLIQSILLFNFYTSVFTLLTYLVLLLFIYKPHKLSFLGNKAIVKVGVASYSIYLIHQNIGVVIINRFSPLFGTYNWLIPIIITGSLTLFGLYSYKYLEVPLGNLVKRLLFIKIKEPLIKFKSR
jgi:peptidoglycan/LPS O-acetylase OafA/YrhL